MTWVYVFDYASGAIYEFTCNELDDVEKLIVEKGFRLKDCYYMVTYHKLNIINIDKK